MDSTNEVVVCQSCGMPMMATEDFGTNKDGSQNDEYCTYCFQDGEFTWNGTLEEMINKQAGMATQMGMSEEDARNMATDNLPKLKRWSK